MKYRLLLLLACLFGLASFSHAAEPTKDPILRIDAGTHTAVIRRISTDAANRTVLTAADDKTARLYDIESGELLKIFRPPIGAGNEGKLFACALSPDETLAAVGGWTKLGSETGHTIYLIDTATGALVRRISGMKNVIFHLVFSPDGRSLAASLGQSNGIRLFRTADGEELARDSDYAGYSNSVHFAPDGRIVSTCYDGELRLHDRELNLLKKVKVTGGERPYGARFSPDGSRIAVGYNDSTVVEVFSGATLKHLFSADTEGVDRGSLNSVAWSADGRTLYATGRYSSTTDGKRTYPVLAWSEGGRGPRVEHAVGANDSMLDLAPLTDGRLLFGAADPALGALNPDGGSRLLARPSVADYRTDLEDFKVSVDGAVVRFGYRSGGKSPARFDVRERQLLVEDEGTETLFSPRTKADSFKVTDWKNGYDPKLDETELKLQRYESSRSLAIAPDEQRLLLGSDWHLRCIGPDGKEIWRKASPGAAWSVNIAPNGRTAVAAYGDGTIRWHRLSDGEELLAFFPHADRKRWVLWTPSGYYAASPGGEELIGWHLNNGKDQSADFFPASRFRGSRYRPDIVARVLETFDEAEAVAAANAASNRRESVALAKLLPPVVTLLGLKDGDRVSSEQIDLNFSVRSPSGAEVTGIKVLVDGRPVTRERGIGLKTKQGSGTRSVSVTIPPRDCEVAVIAETADTTSVPASIRLTWAGAAPAQQEFVAKPKLYVLSIGVSEYQDKNLSLGFAAKDAKDFTAALEKQKGGLYREVVTKALTDAEATKDNILDGLDWLEAETTSRDVAMLFVAGHGLNDKNGSYYYLPHNTRLDRLKRTGVMFADIKNTLAGLAGKALFFVDTCHSGNVMGGRRAAPTDINGLVNELASAENGAVVFASSTGRQYSLEDPAWGNGAFTKALVEGLSGKADYTGQGKVSINMLDLYLSERVKELTGGKQTPTTTKPHTIQDFPVAVKM